MSDQKENIEAAEITATEQPEAAEVNTEASAESKPQKPARQPKVGKPADAEAEGQALSRQKLQECGRAALRRHGLGTAWVTSDGTVFAQEGDAKSHARGLKVKDIINVKA